MTNDDRVSEVYSGKTGSKDAQRVCRERIHWLVAQLTGRRVLDIGCSQGVASILAGRAGYEVLGIDRESPQIEYANAALQAEAPEVRERVRFELADIFETELFGETFDSVIVAEILEHQKEPRRFFERAVRFLVPGGRIVMTTPFGLSVHDDHEQTFYLSEFTACVRGLCEPESFAVVDDYIRFTARSLPSDGIGAVANTPAASMFSDAGALLRASEQAFLSKEWRGYNIGKDRLAKLKWRTRKLRRLEVRASEQEAALARLRQQLQEMSHAMQAERRKHKRQLKEAKVPWPVNSVKKAARSIRQKTDPQYTDDLKRKLRIKAAKISHHPRWPLRPIDGFSLIFDPYEPEQVQGRNLLKIATIFDTFSQHCFQYEAELLPITREGWQAEIEAFKPVFLLAESAWRGNGGQWNYLMSNYAKREGNPLRELLAWCRENGLPTVFWNKEDPANFEVFVAVAKDFDYVFTTDGACIDRYREIVGHSRVFALPFAAQPVIHNPMQRRTKQRNVCFAGSWRAEKYPERGHDSEILLKPAMEYGLEIFDRFAGTKDEEKFRFPPEYAKAVRGSLEYERMLTAYRAYKVFLNVNSVKDSPTMFSRRVFELLACGTPVVSSESAGIRALLGEHVKVVDSESDARRELGRLLGDDEYRGRVAHAGYREVMTHHTYRTRLAQITEQTGITGKLESAPLISVLAPSNRPNRLENILSNYRAQHYPELELILLLNSDDYDLGAVKEAVSHLPNVQVHQLSQTLTLADCLNYGIDRSSGSYVAKFDDDDLYGPHYLSDLMLCTQFTDAPVLGKRSYFCRLDGSDQSALRFEGNEHRYVEFVHGATLLIRRTLFDRIRFTPVKQGTDTVFQRTCRQYGEKIYSADPYNFVHVRHADKSKHTWQVEDEELLAKCTRVKPGLPLDEMMF